MSATPGRSGRVARRGAARDVAARRRRGRPSGGCPPGCRAVAPIAVGLPGPVGTCAVARSPRQGSRVVHRSPVSRALACAQRRDVRSGWGPVDPCAAFRNSVVRVRPSGPLRTFVVLVTGVCKGSDACHLARAEGHRFIHRRPRGIPSGPTALWINSVDSPYVRHPPFSIAARRVRTRVRPRTASSASPSGSAARRGRGLGRRSHRRRRASRRADPAAWPRGARRGRARASAR